MVRLNADSLGALYGACMNKSIAITIVLVTVLFSSASLHTQERPAAPAALAVPQTESDVYTRYELLAPETASFKIYYEETATTPGAKVDFNPIRKGSAASDEAVYDAMTGPL